MTRKELCDWCGATEDLCSQKGQSPLPHTAHHCCLFLHPVTMQPHHAMHLIHLLTWFRGGKKKALLLFFRTCHQHHSAALWLHGWTWQEHTAKGSSAVWSYSDVTRRDAMCQVFNRAFQKHIRCVSMRSRHCSADSLAQNIRKHGACNSKMQDRTHWDWETGEVVRIKAFGRSSICIATWTGKLIAREQGQGETLLLPPTTGRQPTGWAEPRLCAWCHVPGDRVDKIERGKERKHWEGNWKQDRGHWVCLVMPCKDHLQQP